MNQPLRIVLVEDHATVRAGLRLLIDSQPDLAVVGEASNGDDAIRCAQRDGVDVVIMDLSMPGTSGLFAARALRESRPAVKVVVLTRHADQTYLQELLRAGVSGYVLKQSPHDELLHAIRAAAGGGQYIDSALMRHVAAPFLSSGQRQRQPGAASVTDRELTVLRLSAQGHSNKEIAQQLDVVVKTVEVHKANGMRKLRLHGRIELLQFAVLQGWLGDSYQHDTAGITGPLG
ncbi:Nitrogen regulation protein C [Luteitalea pratensis]|uniref:Nitrogen regulation protein C n=1 Tax=Luteitalea pratensis TaxID=1855912 RepID=A0A143PUF1_LUTPR|nr:response regulator transcription factor [Luteitalea pratensis]AMY11808.1 Nitrogen regulation protein C [Luteitalea pratensis]